MENKTKKRNGISCVVLFVFSLQLFEGMKAYRGADNHIRLFRPMLNMERMHRSAERSSLPVSLYTIKNLKISQTVYKRWISYIVFFNTVHKGSNLVFKPLASLI